MDATTLFIPLIPVTVGLFYALYSHSSNTNRHPDTNDLVFKDVCKPEMQRIEDLSQKEINNLKELMNQRFDSLELLIRNGGRPKIKL